MDVMVEVEVISWVDSGAADPEVEEVAALVMVAEDEVNQFVEYTVEVTKKVVVSSAYDMVVSWGSKE